LVLAFGPFIGTLAKRIAAQLDEMGEQLMKRTNLNNLAVVIFFALVLQSPFLFDLTGT
jgi:hypothetical protein